MGMWKATGRSDSRQTGLVSAQRGTEQSNSHQGIFQKPQEEVGMLRRKSNTAHSLLEGGGGALLAVDGENLKHGRNCQPPAIF